MNYNTTTLSNGLRIIHLPSASPVVYCGYEINAGSRDESRELEGIAHYCEHTTFKGTKRRNAIHIINSLECVGGDLNAYTNKEDTVYYAAILHEHLPKAVDLLTDIVFHSTYPQAELDKEVEVICDEIEIYNDSPAELIYDDFENLVFKEHPLGHKILGDADQLRTYKTADALQFTGKFYRPDNAVFFAYGDVDFRRLVKLLEKATSDFAPSLPVMADLSVPANNIPLTNYRPQTVETDRHTHQAHVMMGNIAYDVHNEKRMALYLLNNVLGGPSMNTRLNLSLRERHGLVYSVESSMVSYSDTGLWCVYFGCDAKDVRRCEHLVRKELDKLMNCPLSDAQLRAAKRQIEGQIGVACDNRENFALDFGKSFLHYGWEKDITSLYQHIDALDSRQLQEVAQEIFAPEKTSTLVYL